GADTERFVEADDLPVGVTVRPSRSQVVRGGPLLADAAVHLGTHRVDALVHLVRGRVRRAVGGGPGGDARAVLLQGRRLTHAVRELRYRPALLDALIQLGPRALPEVIADANEPVTRLGKVPLTRQGLVDQLRREHAARWVIGGSVRCDVDVERVGE